MEAAAEAVQAVASAVASAEEASAVAEATITEEASAFSHSSGLTITVADASAEL